MRSRLSFAVLFGLSLTCLISGGCPDLLGPAEGTGNLKLLITDKPFPIDLLASAEITITRVEVRLAQTSTEDEEASRDEDTSDDEGTDASKKKDPAEGDETHGQGHGHGHQGLADDGQVEPDPEEGDSQDQSQDEQAEQDEDESSSQDELDDGDEDTADQDETDEDGAESTFITVFEGERTFDLLSLRNGRADLLADTDIPAGQYDQMRLIVTSGRVVLIDGREFELTVPSGAQSGIKLHFTFEVQDGQEAPLLLDVNLSRAFKPIPGGHIDDPSKIREIKFQPSIAMRLINLLEAGSISGTVTDVDTNPLAGALVTAYNSADEEVTSTSTDADGTYVLAGLLPGQYRLEFSATGYDPGEVPDVTVTSGQDTPDVNIALSPAAEPEPGSISGMVTDLDENPLEGALVTAYNSDDEEAGSTTTEADGTYVLADLLPGQYRLEFSATGFADGEISDVTVTAGQDTPDVNITLSPA